MTDLKDHRGTEIKVGDKVAFNYQGMVGVGHVKELKSVTQYGRSKTHIVINREFPSPRSRYAGTKAVSVVTNPLNLIVIHEYEDIL